MTAYRNRNQGTGSCPCPPHGLQREIRFIASQPPFNTPYFLIASVAYAEQVGVKRQEDGSQGEITFW